MTAMKIYLPNGATQLISTLFAHQSSISVGSEGALQLEGLPPQAFQLWQKKYFWGEAQFFVTPLSKDIEILRNGMLLSESTQVLNNDKITVLGQTLTFDLAANAKRFSLANKVLSISILLSIILIGHQYYYHHEYETLWQNIESDLKSDNLVDITSQIEKGDGIEKRLLFSPPHELRAKLVRVFKRFCDNSNDEDYLSCQLFATKHLLLYDPDPRKRAEYVRDTQSLRMQIDYVLPVLNTLKSGDVAAALTDIEADLRQNLEDETLLVFRDAFQDLLDAFNKRDLARIDQIKKTLKPYPYALKSINAAVNILFKPKK